MDYDRSPLWGMASAGALGAGGYYGMRGRWGELQRAAMGPGTTSLDRLRDLGAGSTRYAAAPFSSVEALGNLAVDSPFHSAWKSRVADLTYESMMGIKNPVGHSAAQKAMSRVMEAAGQEGSDLTSVYSKAMAELKAAGGDTARFTKAVNSLSTENLTSFNTVRLGNIGDPMQKQGINEIISRSNLRGKEGEELEKILGRLGAKDIFGDRLDVRNVSFRRIDDSVTMARIPITGVGDVDLPLSINETSTMYGGKNYTSKYITRGAWDIGRVEGVDRALIIKNYNEHYLDILSTNMSNDFGAKRSAKAALYETDRRVAQSMMDNADMAAGKAAIFAEDFVTSGGALKQGMAADQLVFGGKKLTPALLEEAITLSANMGRPLTPFAGAGAVGKGALMQGDVRSQVYGSIGELFPAQKQPLQFLRGDFGLSQDAIDMAGQPGFRFGGAVKGQESALNNYVGRLSNYKGYQRANLVTVYATQGSDVVGIMADEMGYMSNNVAELQSYERMKSVTVRASEGMAVHPAIAEKLTSDLAFNEKVRFDSPISIDDSRALGIDVKTNKAYEGALRGAPSEITGFKRLDEGRIKIYTREYHDMGGLARKYFGQGDIKHMIQGVTPENLMSKLKSTGFAGDRVLGNISPELYVTASRFQGGKNAAALSHQQITAMQIMLAARADRTGTMSDEVKSFMKSPMQFLEEEVFSKSKSTTIAGLQTEVQDAIVRKAQSFNLTGGALGRGGLIFGALDEDQIEGMFKRGVIEKGEADAWKKARHVVGMSAPSLGDLAFEGGSGKMGTMDVSGFRVLSQKGYKGAEDLGARAAIDIAERTLSPGAYDEIAKMQGSIIGADNSLMGKVQGFVSGTDKAIDLEGFGDNLVSEEGRWFNTGKAGKAAGIAENIYIPGTAAAEQLLPTTNTITGEALNSQVHRSLSSLKYQLGQGDEAAIRAAADDLAAASHSEYARSATSRGKVLGSRLLTGQQMTAAQQEAMGDAIGLSKRTGLDMFDEMIARAPAERRSFLEGQKALFAEGKAVSAVGWRHPNVGPESVQFLKMQAMQGADDALAYMPQKIGSMTINGKEVQRDLSQLVGWKGDFDKDQFVLSAIGEESVDQGARRALNNSVNTKYNKYLGTHYGMEEMITRHAQKADSPLRGISALREEARAHGYVKMATGQTNVALQKAKVAIAANAPEYYDDLATAMWHLEETAAIGSKHGTIGGGDLYERISKAINKQDEKGLASVFETVFGKGEQTINTVVEGEKTAVTMNPQQYARRIMDAIRQTPDEVFASVELSQAAKGSSNASREAMLNQFTMMQSGRSRDVASRLATGAESSALGRIEGSFAKMSGRARAVGQVLGRNKKPLMLGAAIAATIAAAAPSMAGSLKKNPNQMGAAGGNNVNPEDSAPPGGLEMNPPKKAIMRSPRAYEMTSRVQGNYKANDMQRDNAAIMRQVAAARAGGANARMSVQDNRSVLDSRSMANKIHERM